MGWTGTNILCHAFFKYTLCTIFQQLVHVEVKENLWNRTEGLCGVLDDDPSNDVLTKDGEIRTNVISAALSWKADDLESKNTDFVPIRSQYLLCFRPV